MFLVGFGQGKRYWLSDDRLGAFRLFLVDVPSGNYDARFLPSRFFKESVPSSLLGVAVWSNLILNFEGIVAGIELSGKTTVV